MLQRIQTIYLLVCVIASAVLPFVFPLWILEPEIEVYFTESTITMILFGLIALLALISIFSFKKRQNQFVLNRLNIILNFILLGFFVYRTLNLSGETEVSEKGIGIVLPAISIVMLVLANRAIKKDEDLVKSVDRLR
jgi:LPXTG-motif cell wall-anchored protein